MADILDLLTSLSPTRSPISQLAEENTLNAVAWARVSTDMQEERGLSIPEQLAEIRRYATREGLKIVTEFHEASSAFQRPEKRLEFRRMLQAVQEQRSASIILVHDFSRFSRQADEASVLLRDLRRSGVRVVSVTEGELRDDTVMGVWQKHITLAKNEAYSREVAFHTLKGCKANVKTRDPETGWCYKNGGQPLFGYKSEQLVRGEERRGRPILKSIWREDTTLVKGCTIAEWTAQCLQMAAEGVSLGQISEFCNDNGIPAPRSARGWTSNTWHYLLQPVALLKYCGHEVYNVHDQHGRLRPSEEWVVVEDAHPALITPELAQAIAKARADRRIARFDVHSRGSRKSNYLLTGGLFTCGRCGGNMVGYVNGDGTRYRCSTLNRGKAFRCGPGVLVRQEQIDDEVLIGMQEWLAECLADQGVIEQVNAQYRQLWEEASGYDPLAACKLADIDRKIANLRRAFEDDLDDEERRLLMERVRGLKQEREGLAGRVAKAGEPPTVDAIRTRAVLGDLDRMLAEGTPVERKAIVRECVESVVLYPDALMVEITYHIPGAPNAMNPGNDTEVHCNRSGSGGGILRLLQFPPEKQTRCFLIPKNGRKRSKV